MNNYYTATGWPTYKAPGDSASPRSELVAIESGFDKLPILTGAALYLVRVKSDQTGLESVSPTVIKTSLGIDKASTMVFAISDEATALTTGAAKFTFRMPYTFTVSSVRASLTTASTSGIPTFDINENGVSILSTKLTIDANEKTSTTATTAAVLSDTALANDAEITIDIDVAGTGATGAKIYILGTPT